MSWQTVPQPRTCSSKASVSIAAAGPSDDTCLWLGREQLMMTFVRDQLTVGGQERWSHTGQWQVDQSGHLEVPDAEPKASAAPVAPALCGHASSPLHQRAAAFWTDCSRLPRTG